MYQWSLRIIAKDILNSYNFQTSQQYLQLQFLMGKWMSSKYNKHYRKIVEKLLTECPRKRQTKRKGHVRDFVETRVVWPTHGWGWPHKIFLVWGHPCGQGSSTLGLILLVTSKFFLTAPRCLDLSFCYILVKALMGNFEFWPWPAIFWRGPSLKKIFTPMTPSKNGFPIPKLKISH